MIETASVAPTFALQAAGGSDPGRVRTSNEDRHHVDVDQGIFLVADGVGGHAAGEVAASIAVEVAVQRLSRRAGTPEQRVREAIALANNEIFKQSKRSPQHAGMTCVMTLAILTDRRLTIGHVGDSRLYKLTPRGIAKVTHDHSPIGEREDAREISEVEAMRHPRRNEVFRDVGSAFHEPDDRDFIEVIDISFEPDVAIVLCSDGLSDMVPSTSIQRIVRAHAGNPAAVVQALITAANDAGGKDNITVVYAEGGAFAATVGSSSPDDNAAVDVGQGNPADVWASVRAFFGSRGMWLAAGVLLGLGVAIGLSLIPPFDRYITGPRARTIVAGGTARGQYPSIQEALASAAAGDTVQIEPGEYTEPIVLRNGVDLVARTPGTVTLLAPSRYMGWVSIAVVDAGSRISGIRIIGQPTAPVSVGIRIGGQDSVVDDVSVEGDVAVGVEVVTDGQILVRSSRFVDVKGLPLRVGALSRPMIRHNQFVRSAPADQARAVEIAANAAPQLVANLFVGYRNAVAGPAGVTDSVLRKNYSIRDDDDGRQR